MTRPAAMRNDAKIRGQQRELSESEASASAGKAKDDFVPLSAEGWRAAKRSA